MKHPESAVRPPCRQGRDAGPEASAQASSPGWLHVSLLGRLDIRLVDASGAARPVYLTRRPANLLAFLALSNRGRCHRQELVALLWGETDHELGRGIFNTALWRLRKAVEQPPLAPGQIIRCDRSGLVGLCDDGSLRTDTEAYTALVAPVLSKPVDMLTLSDTLRLEQGVALYGGELLAGFNDGWVLREREKLRRAQLDALRRLMYLAADRGDLDAAIQHAQALLDIDPLREDVHRDLIRLHLRAGQRALALLQFDRCRAVLQRELAIAPMRETFQLYRLVVEGAEVDTRLER